MYFIYASNSTEAIECSSLEEAHRRFGAPLAFARQRGAGVSETEEHRWLIAPQSDNTYLIWTADKDNNTIFFKE